ncbi:thylakoid lumenal 29 kDa protein, chloroplastic-like [Camellia sinensis]|uniref:thylakoid lumenal 29 kDa protein, chloroplastic-like n=1 Tax=Camellia sinensis TaxID=4442 RepID=UPI001036F151|nr:thylakoid lumenal 29 kDa protein, chloroplastic-like [Camellia sinensis]
MTLVEVCTKKVYAEEIIASSGSFVEEANAADLIQRRQRSEFQSSVKGTLFTAIKANPDLVPSLLTLAMNDAMTYDKATKSGGPNGSARFSSEISRPENKGLSAAMNLLEEAKKEIDSYSKGGPISFADLIQFAGCMSYLSPSLSCTLPTWPLTCSDTLESVIVFMWSVLYKSFVFTNMFIIKFMVDE